MSLQILSQYAGGPRVRATGRSEITTTGSDTASEPVESSTDAQETAAGEMS